MALAASDVVGLEAEVVDETVVEELLEADEEDAVVWCETMVDVVAVLEVDVTTAVTVPMLNTSD